MESHAGTEELHDVAITAAPPARAPSRIGRNLAALGTGQIVTWTMTCAWTLVVPRLIGPAGMGLIVSAWSITGILAIALGLGTRNYLVRAIVVDRSRATGLLATATVLRLLLSPLFLTAVVAYAQFAGDGPNGRLVLYLAAGATIFTLLAEPMQAAFQSNAWNTSHTPTSSASRPKVCSASPLPFSDSAQSASRAAGWSCRP
jgi:O-antigen/teichoic acid export membrane protein